MPHKKKKIHQQLYSIVKLKRSHSLEVESYTLFDGKF